MKTMIDIFKTKMPEGMKIVNEKELNNRFKIEVQFLDVIVPTELSKQCSPGYESRYCKSILWSALAQIYLIKDDIPKVKEYLSKSHI